jgi:hypothetical protein
MSDGANSIVFIIACPKLGANRRDHYPAEIRKAIYTTNAVEALKVAAQDHQNPWRFPQGRSGNEVIVSGSASGRQEMDHADPSLKRSAELLPERMPSLERIAEGKPQRLVHR